MKASITRLPLRAAGLAVIGAVVVSGCAASSGSGTATHGSSAASISPDAAVKLAAKTTGKVSSFAATLQIQLNAKPGAAASTTGLSGNTQMTMSFAEQLHPALLVSVSIGSLSTGGSTLPAGLSEIITPTTMYLKWSYLTQQLHVSKPWLAIPLSAFSKSGVSISQIMDQATGNGPLADSQLLAGATSVRRVGTGSIDGVPVTEYTGTISLSSALAHLSGSLKTMVQQLETTEGASTEKFTIWVDGNNMLRKVATTLAGTTMSETTIMTVTGINQPSDITVPPASQTSPLPNGALG